MAPFYPFNPWSVIKSVSSVKSMGAFSHPHGYLKPKTQHIFPRIFGRLSKKAYICTGCMARWVHGAKLSNRQPAHSEVPSELAQDRN